MRGHVSLNVHSQSVFGVAFKAQKNSRQSECGHNSFVTFTPVAFILKPLTKNTFD